MTATGTISSNIKKLKRQGLHYERIHTHWRTHERMHIVRTHSHTKTSVNLNNVCTTWRSGGGKRGGGGGWGGGGGKRAENLLALVVIKQKVFRAVLNAVVD